MQESMESKVSMFCSLIFLLGKRSFGLGGNAREVDFVKYLERMEGVSKVVDLLIPNLIVVGEETNPPSPYAPPLDPSSHDDQPRCNRLWTSRQHLLAI